nr:MAG TPA: hypothetical protein [Caudoviricetes sp.]
MPIKKAPAGAFFLSGGAITRSLTYLVSSAVM